MEMLYHQLIDPQADNRPGAPAIVHQGNTLSYGSLKAAVEAVAASLRGLGIMKGHRVAVYLPKQEETVIALFAISRTGGIFVPINPVLKPRQVAHILADCGTSMLITSADRVSYLAEIFPHCPTLEQIVVVGADEAIFQKSIQHLAPAQHFVQWQEVLQGNPTEHPHIQNDDSVAILYTSGSTGKPKGVVVTHQNLVTGSESVCNFLNINNKDRILALLPFSFDYGLNQLTTAIHSGACLVLMNYLLPQEVPRRVASEAITGLAAVPTLWAQLANLDWPASARHSLRYLTSSGGPMPQTVLRTLQAQFPRTDIFLMYGLTEAFRSTYLPPDELAQHPTSMGKAIPNARLAVVRPDGTRCQPGEPGELVHSGPLVAKGYWNNPEKTARRFKPLPVEQRELQATEIAVWSGDTVTMDEDGYFYFVGREDDMIKTSGYRVSPTEVEEVIYETGLVSEAVVFGVPHPDLGQAIVAVVVASTTPMPKVSANAPDIVKALHDACKVALPLFMVPIHIDARDEIPKTPHGKLARKHLSKELQNLFTDNEPAPNVINTSLP